MNTKLIIITTKDPMTFTKWIVPEPDPKLSLRVQDIDITLLNYGDIRFIYSSVMKKYIHEFEELLGFRKIVEKIIEDEKINRIMKKNKHCAEGIPPYNRKRVSSIKINRRPNETIINNPVYYKKTYLETVDSYGKYLPQSRESSEACSVS